MTIARTIREIDTAVRDWVMRLPATASGYRPALGYDFLPGDLNDLNGVGVNGAALTQTGGAKKVPSAQYPAIACHHIGDDTVQRSLASQTYRAKVLIKLYVKYEDARVAQYQLDELIQAIRDAANADSSLGGRVKDAVVGLVTRTPPIEWAGQLVRTASVQMDVFTTS